jgi:hypothetical protein
MNGNCKLLEFFKVQGHNSVSNYGSIVLKTELDLDILMINLYTKFYFNMCNQCKENEWKLQIIEIFRSPRGKTELDLDILMINLYTKFHVNMCNHCKENEQKLQIIGIFEWLDRTQNITWPIYSYDKSVYQISFQYVQPVQRKLTETANYWTSSKSKGHNSVKNCSIAPKTELDQDILMIELYTKFFSISATSVKKMNGNCW